MKFTLNGVDFDIPEDATVRIARDIDGDLTVDVGDDDGDEDEVTGPGYIPAMTLMDLFTAPNPLLGDLEVIAGRGASPGACDGATSGAEKRPVGNPLERAIERRNRKALLRAFARRLDDWDDADLRDFFQSIHAGHTLEVEVVFDADDFRADA